MWKYLKTSPMTSERDYTLVGISGLSASEGINGVNDGRDMLFFKKDFSRLFRLLAGGEFPGKDPIPCPPFLVCGSDDL